MMRFNVLDDEIYQAERLIALNRSAFDTTVSDTLDHVRDRTRNTLSSPKFLLGLLAAGGLVGYMLLAPRERIVLETPPSAAKKSLWGVIGAGAFSLVQAQFGGPVGLARWILTKLNAGKAAQQQSYYAP
jgi:hypothetical protein